MQPQRVGVPTNSVRCVAQGQFAACNIPISAMHTPEVTGACVAHLKHLWDRHDD